jgi:glutamate-1-semialdehyde 2,1-aminomutase
MNINNKYLKKGKNRIPGLTQLLSKRPDQFSPDTWPTYFSKAAETEIWDLDGNKFLDMSISGIGANILGYCDQDVDQAVISSINNGNSSSLNCPEEVDLADLLCELHPWANKVRFSRTGGESMAIAVRIARAFTKKDKIVFCGYHGWHDWYLAANLSSDSSLEGHLLPGLNPAGVPKGLEGTSIPFEFNNLDQLKEIFQKNKGEIAAVVMEPMRSVEPLPGFLEEIRKITKTEGSALVFDEISSGFRSVPGGLHLLHKVDPDIAVFGKAMSNGYPMGAIIGTDSIMDACQKTFISSTYWTDRIGPTAAIATIDKFIANNVHETLIATGKKMQNIWLEASSDSGVDISVTGMYPMSYFAFKEDKNLEKMTFFIQQMLNKGILASNRFYANYCHNDVHLEIYKQSAQEIFALINRFSNSDNLNKEIIGEPMNPGFHRFN